MRKLICIMMTGLLVTGSCNNGESYLKEIQVTTDATKNHDLDNNDNFSPDGKWLVYDTRNDVTAIAGCASIERVNIETGKTEVLYEIKDNQDFGPGVGAASYNPSDNTVIFIHGIPACTNENPYQQWRRTGVMIRDTQPNVPIYMDSRDVTFPFTPGALRGGTHRHEWSRDGKWIGYTYNDAIMKHLEDSTGVKWNLRTMAVSNNQHLVKPVDDNTGENINGRFFSAVVVRVVPEPLPGSDEISNAASDSWVGNGSYIKPDGSRKVARAFLGKVRSKSGIPVDELFVVEIPDSINVPGEFGPLEGTLTSFPNPPKGTVQRRLTHTAESEYPGCSQVVRSSSDGKYISYCGHDKKGIQQIFIISPEGEGPVQVTEHSSDVQSGARWSPDNSSVAYIWDNSLVVCKISDDSFVNRFKRLTERSVEAPTNHVWSHDGKIIAFNRFVYTEDRTEKRKQIFIIKLDPPSDI
jgi:hypothetical protein